MVLGAKRLGYGGETTRVGNRGEMTRGKRLGAKRLVTVNSTNCDIHYKYNIKFVGELSSFGMRVGDLPRFRTLRLCSLHCDF